MQREVFASSATCEEHMWDKVIDIEVCRDCAKEIDEYLTKKLDGQGES